MGPPPVARNVVRSEAQLQQGRATRCRAPSRTGLGGGRAWIYVGYLLFHQSPHTICPIDPGPVTSGTLGVACLVPARCTLASWRAGAYGGRARSVCTVMSLWLPVCAPCDTEFSGFSPCQHTTPVLPLYNHNAARPSSGIASRVQSCLVSAARVTRGPVAFSKASGISEYKHDAQPQPAACPSTSLRSLVPAAPCCFYQVPR